MFIKILKFIIDIGIVFLGIVISLFYLTGFVLIKMQEFITTAGIVFGSLVALCSLVLSYTSIVENPSRKVILKGISRDLLHGSFYFLLTALFGIFALKVSEAGRYPELSKFVKWILVFFGIIYLSLSWRYNIRAVDRLIDFMWGEEFGEDKVNWFGFKIESSPEKEETILHDRAEEVSKPNELK